MREYRVEWLDFGYIYYNPDLPSNERIIVVLKVEYREDEDSSERFCVRALCLIEKEVL